MASTAVAVGGRATVKGRQYTTDCDLVPRDETAVDEAAIIGEWDYAPDLVDGDPVVFGWTVNVTIGDGSTSVVFQVMTYDGAALIDSIATVTIAVNDVGDDQLQSYTCRVTVDQNDLDRAGAYALVCQVIGAV